MSYCEEEVGFFSSERLGCRSGEDLIDSVTSFHDALVAGLYLRSNIACLASLQNQRITPMHNYAIEVEDIFFAICFVCIRHSTVDI